MIRALRSRHRAMVTVLALVLAWLFVASLQARREPAVQDSLPAALSGESAAGRS